MASRAESRVTPIPFLTVGGVNQRVQVTELQTYEYSNLVGVFPEFAGLQSRVWGKRVLAKYDSAVYGIHQFWTPMGYGGGLYQFDGTLDYGYWLTPNSIWDLVPPLPGFDGGGMTLDEFGQGYGENFGYGDVNTCTLSFLNGNSNHSACNPAPTPAATPNDTNGGPAGQGRKCKWTTGIPSDVVIPAPSSTQYGVWSTATHTGAGPTPFPILPTIPTQRPTVYSGGGGPFGNIWYASCNSSSAKINLGGGSWREDQSAGSANTTGLLDLTGLIDFSNPPSVIEILVTHNGNSPFVSVWVPLAASIENYAAIPIDVWTFIQTTYRSDPNPLGGGFVVSDFVKLERIRFTYTKRICN